MGLAPRLENRPIGTFVVIADAQIAVQSKYRPPFPTKWTLALAGLAPKSLSRSVTTSTPSRLSSP